MAVVGAVGSFLGGKEAAKGAEKAAQAELEAARLTTKEAKRQFDEMMKRQNPQYEAGLSALNKQMFYAGVPVPTGTATKLSEIGVSPYPTISPYGEYMPQSTVPEPAPTPTTTQQAPSNPWANGFLGGMFGNIMNNLR